MKVTSNIGVLNAMIRITCGLTMLSLFTAKLVKRPWKQSYWIMIFLSSMKVAEGIVRYCPVTAMYSQGRNMYKDMLDDLVIDDSDMSTEESQSTFNPS